MIRLADYILHKVTTRKLPRSINAEVLEQKPNVVMKLDIEGSELEVLTDLLVTSAFIELGSLRVITLSRYKTTIQL